MAKIADEAAKTAKTKTCSVPTVSKALAGQPNENVLDALRRLLSTSAEPQVA